MSQLRINCFQIFEVVVGKKTITSFRSAKGRALLAYLAVEQDHPHRRESLAGLLWPDETEARARRNLSQTLLELRQAIRDRSATPPYLQISNQTIALNPAGEHWVDVADFNTKLAATSSHPHDRLESCADCMTQLQQAVALYRDPLLDGFYVDESDLFETWILTQREQLQQQALDALTTLSRYYEGLGDYDAAQNTVRRRLTLVPWQEEAHQQLMRLLALNGERSLALAQYDICCQALDDELGVLPSVETTTLYDQILAGQMGRVAPPPPAVAPTSASAAPFQAIAPPPHFVGRDNVLVQLQQWIRQPGLQIYALVGMGGVGKTALAAALAHQCRDDFVDGVLWANAATSAPLDIMTAWARAYGHDYSNLPDLESRGTALRGLLSEKQALLILDNVDHSSSVKPLLPSGQSGAVLLTTRDLDVAHSLNAQVILLGELTAAGGHQLLNRILGADRVSEEETAAQTICRLLQYLPLAVEIAAQRLKSRPRQKLAQMAARLQHEQHRLGLKISDQAVRASFEVSWQALSTDLQSIFANLAVFASRPFILEAAAAIANIDLFDAEDALYAFIALSLMKEAGENHYQQHPLLADFAQEKLTETDAALTRMSDYYLEYCQTHQEDYGVLHLDWENIVAAIETAHQQQRWQMVIQFANILSQTWGYQGRYSDARRIYRWADEAARQLQDELLLAANQLRWGLACLEQNDYDPAEKHLTDSLKRYQALDHQPGTATALEGLGRIALEQGRYDQAKVWLLESLTMRSQLGDTAGVASVFFNQARLYYATSALDEAQQVGQEALNLQQDLADQQQIISTLRLLAQIALLQQSLDLAYSYCEQAQRLSEQLQDEEALAGTLYTLTCTLRYQKKFAQAKAQGEKGLALFRRMGMRRPEGQLLYQLSAIHKESAQYEQALDLDLQSIQIFKALSADLDCAYSLMLLGDIYQLLGESEESQRAWQEARSLGESLNHQTLLSWLETRLA